MESFVRKHLAEFVSGVGKVLARALPEIYPTGDYSWGSNTITYIRDRCLAPDFCLKDDFVYEGGEPMKRNRAFAEGIKQFFKDEDFAMGIIRAGIRQYRKENNIKAAKL